MACVQVHQDPTRALSVPHSGPPRIQDALAQRPHEHCCCHCLYHCRYFYIPARKEHRGLGGLFFDDLSSADASYDVEQFTKDVGDGILPSWLSIVERRRDIKFTEEQRNWQLLRRGRYLVGSWWCSHGLANHVCCMCVVATVAYLNFEQ